MGAKEIVDTENCAMRKRDRAILCVADVNTTDNWGRLSGPLRSIMGVSGDGTEEEKLYPATVCPSKGGFPHRGL